VSPPPLDGPNGLEEPELFVAVLRSLHLHILKIGTESGPETSENFLTLTRQSAQELNCAVGNKFVYIHDVEGRFANIKMLDSCLFVTLSS